MTDTGYKRTCRDVYVNPNYASFGTFFLIERLTLNPPLASSCGDRCIRAEIFRIDWDDPFFLR